MFKGIDLLASVVATRYGLSKRAESADRGSAAWRTSCSEPRERWPARRDD